MENSLRKMVRQLIRENYQEELMDLILDKIAKYGEKSLLPHERSVLDKISSGKSNLKNDEDLVYDFLDFTLGELKADSYHSNKLGKKVSGIRYFDNYNSFVFDLEVDSEVLGIKKEINYLYADDSLKELLQSNFQIDDSNTKEILKRWFEKKTGQKPSKIDFWFSGK